MGVVWEWYGKLTKRGSHYWGPENPIDHIKTSQPLPNPVFFSTHGHKKFQVPKMQGFLNLIFGYFGGGFFCTSILGT